MNEFMNEAIKLSIDNLHTKDGGPFGACVVKDGVRQFERENLSDIREYVNSQLENEIWAEEQRFENPHAHYLDMTPAYFDMKLSLLDERIVGE